MNNPEEFIYYEDPNIYDGWLLMYRPSDKKIIWRDYIVRQKGLTEENKEEIESYVHKNLMK